MKTFDHKPDGHFDIFLDLRDLTVDKFYRAVCSWCGIGSGCRCKSRGRGWS
jgi:hypothetical protein